MASQKYAKCFYSPDHSPFISAKFRSSGQKDLSNATSDKRNSKEVEKNSPISAPEKTFDPDISMDGISQGELGLFSLQKRIRQKFGLPGLSQPAKAAKQVEGFALRCPSIQKLVIHQEPEGLKQTDDQTELNQGRKQTGEAGPSHTDREDSENGLWPSAAELEQEARRIRYRKRFWKTMVSTINVLIVTAAVSILAATLWFPVLRIYGSSMTPTLQEGDVALSMKTGAFAPGDLIAFYYNNKILIKRVIAGPGDWVDLDQDGQVFVNGELLNEPYIKQKSRGEVNIELPFQVPADRWFVMGDHREASLDSRTRAIGPVAEEQIVGRLVWRLWPLNEFQSLDE